MICPLPRSHQRSRYACAEQSDRRSLKASIPAYILPRIRTPLKQDVRQQCVAWAVVVQTVVAAHIIMLRRRFPELVHDTRKSLTFRLWAVFSLVLELVGH
jgi:hypothetical protein